MFFKSFAKTNSQSFFKSRLYAVSISSSFGTPHKSLKPTNFVLLLTLLISLIILGVFSRSKTGSSTADESLLPLYSAFFLLLSERFPAVS